MNLRTIATKIKSGKDLDDGEKEYILKKINMYWDEHPDVINRFPRWRKYIAWVAGYQLYDYNKISKKLVEVPLQRQHKLIFNRLRPYVRTMLAKLTAEVPQMSVIPNTNEDDDVRAARIGEKVVAGLSDRLGFIQELNNVKLWLIICNRAFFRVFWDDNANGIVEYGVPEQGESESEGEGINSGGENEEPEKIEAIPEEGELCIQCVPPFNCRVDPLYWNHNDWRWFVYGQEVDAADLEDEYKLEKGSISKDRSDTMDSAYQLDLQDEQDILIGAPDKREDIGGRTTVFKQLWTPDVWIFTAGDKVLDYGVNDYHTIPFFACEDRLVPIDTYQREFQFNESIIKDLIPLQREYNRMYSIQSIALDRASKLKIMTPIGSMVSKRQWVNEYGVFIDYNPRQGTPYQMKMEPFPMEVPAYKQDLEREMESMLSLSPASFGRLPERASHASGTLVNLLLEQDEVVLNPLLNHVNDVIGQVWTLGLRIVQKNYNTSRLIKFVGTDGTEDVIKFSGADLRGNTDVKVISQSGLPRSRALKIEYIMKLREIGLLTDDKATMEMLEFGNAEKVFSDNLLNERKAYRENAMIVANPTIDTNVTTVWIYPLEDHNVHMKIHLRLRLGLEYDRLSVQQKGALDFHLQQHMSIVQGIAPPEPPQPTAGQPPNEPMAGPPQGQPTPQATAAPVM